MKQTFKQDKGVAGLTILLSVVVMLFIIGLLIAIFSIMSGELGTSLYDTSTRSVVNETVTTVTEKGDNLALSTLRDATCSVTRVTNTSVSVPVITSGNYTVSGCRISNTGTDTNYNNSNWNVTYTVTYSGDNDATDTINDTSGALKGAVDWFDIFIVITAMVVLILLTVIIITAVRSSGMIAGAGSQQNNTVGTA